MKIILLISLLSIVDVHGAVYQLNARTLAPKSYEIKLQADYWQTTSFYDVDGNEVEMVVDQSFDKYEINSQIKYAFINFFELDVFLNFRQMNAYTSTYGDTSEGGVESFGGWVHKGFPASGKWNFKLSLGLKLPAFSNPDFDPAAAGDSSLAMGDEVNELRIGGSLGYNYSNMFKQNFDLYYNLVTKDQSDEILYDTHLAFIPGMKFAAMIGVDGIYSMGQDPYSDNPADKPQIGPVVSNLYNSINRDYLRPYIGFNFAFNKNFRMEFRAKAVVAGTSTDKGQQYGLAIVFGKEGEDPKTKVDKSSKEYDIEASVIKVSTQGNFIQIDKGFDHDIRKGMKIDFYEFDYKGGNVLVASGIVFQVNSELAVVKIHTRYQQIPIKVGFVARAKHVVQP